MVLGRGLWYAGSRHGVEEASLAVKVNNERLREAREVALLSQRELAEKAGVSLDTVQRMETGEGGVYGRTVRKIATALGLDPHELLGEPASPKALAR